MILMFLYRMTSLSYFYIIQHDPYPNPSVLHFFTSRFFHNLASHYTNYRYTGPLNILTPTHSFPLLLPFSLHQFFYFITIFLHILFTSSHLYWSYQYHNLMTKIISSFSPSFSTSIFIHPPLFLLSCSFSPFHNLPNNHASSQIQHTTAQTTINLVFVSDI